MHPRHTQTEAESISACMLVSKVNLALTIECHGMAWNGMEWHGNRSLALFAVVIDSL